MDKKYAHSTVIKKCSKSIELNGSFMFSSQSQMEETLKGKKEYHYMNRASNST
jgi:hypothetical protein